MAFFFNHYEDIYINHNDRAKSFHLFYIYYNPIKILNYNLIELLNLKKKILRPQVYKHLLIMKYLYQLLKMKVEKEFIILK